MSDTKDAAVQSDESLIRRAQKGDAGAFEEILHRYDRKVLSMALSYTRDPDDAKDVYQEVFIRVYRALPKFQHRSKFSTWVYRIVVNVCRTHQGRRSRNRHVPLDRVYEGDDGGSHSIADFLGGGENTEKPALNAELAGQLERAMEHLSPKQRLVFVLRHYHGFKLREIASMMDCAEGTVKRHLFSATGRLREKLAEVATLDGSR